MRVLMLLSESWNDQTAPNNNMTNWFRDFPEIDIWTISGSSQIPNNKCCQHYFLIGENEMLRSFVSKSKAGKYFYLDMNQKSLQNENKDLSDNKTLKKIFAGEPARFVRDCVWRYGRYNYNGLKKFIDDCNPDIVFSQRKGSIKMCRLEHTVSQLTNAPIVAYTGDDEYSLQQISFSPIFWARRFWTRAWLGKMIPHYKLFYSQSERQMKEFEDKFGVKTKFLVKCGMFEQSKVHKQVHSPIQIVYAGKLYCNRWKTLGMVSKTLREINNEFGEVRIQLNIYTADAVNTKQNELLNDGVNSIIRGCVPPSDLPGIYNASDIVLHVESFDMRNRLLTKDSFSTKVMDCMASGCAVMAVCWEGHAAYQYLKISDAAITASSQEELAEKIRILVENPEVICQYASKAYSCGKRNHQRENIQKMILDDFTMVVKKC